MSDKNPLERKCEECNSILIRKNKEQLFHFEKRRFCNKKCWHKNRTEDISDNMPCNICKKILHISEFSPRKNRPRGVNYTCKRCVNNKNSKRAFTPDDSVIKVCRICKSEKPSSEFFINKRNKSGRSNHCKYCENKRKLRILHNSPETRVRENLRRRVRSALAGTNKSNNTMSLIGCSLEDLKRHIESQFISGMTWDNYGEWHIDHKIPCSSFNLAIAENQHECFNYKNLQPLWAKDNLSKGNKHE